MPSKHCQWSKCIQVQVKKHNKPSLRFSLSLFSCSHIYFSATLISNVMKTTPQALQKIGRKRKMKLKQHLGELNELHFLKFHYFCRGFWEVWSSAPGIQRHFRSLGRGTAALVPVGDSGKCSPRAACSPGTSATGARGFSIFWEVSQSVPGVWVSYDPVWMWNTQLPPSLSPSWNRSNGGQGWRFLCLAFGEVLGSPGWGRSGVALSEFESLSAPRFSSLPLPCARCAIS